MTDNTSTETNSHEQTGKVPEDIADAFSQSQHSSDEPEALQLDDSDPDVVRREMDGKPVAKVYPCNTYECLAYYAVRDENRHFFFKENGYPIDSSILDDLEDRGVEKIFIGLKHSKSVLEFDLEQYTNRDEFDEGWGVQQCAPEEEAQRVWPNTVGALFEDAPMTAI